MSLDWCPTEVVRSDAHEDLLFYTQLCDQRYQDARVHGFLARRLERVVTHRSQRLIFSMPPRHGKSRLAGVELPTWVLGKDPTLRVALASYASSLSEHHSREARTRIQTDEYRSVFDTRLDPASQSVPEWSVMGGGGFQAVGVGGGLTGRGADLLIIDDPIKDHVEAHSLSQRDRVWDWFLSVAMTRLSPGASIVIIMTRWHRDDLVGRLTDPARVTELEEAGGAAERFEYINLPALAEEGDPLGRTPGEALVPNRYPVEALHGIRAAVGSYVWNALYCGRPVRKGGNYIASGKFVSVSRDHVPKGLRWVRYWDTATTDNETSDFTAGVRGAEDGAGNLWLSDMVRGQWTWPLARNRMVAVAKFERIENGMEAVGGFKSAFQNLKEVYPKDLAIREVPTEADKLTRALPWIALLERRKVFLVDGPWVKAFVDECEDFPKGTHDDQVDAVSGVHQMLTGKGRNAIQSKLYGR